MRIETTKVKFKTNFTSSSAMHTEALINFALHFLLQSSERSSMVGSGSWQTKLAIPVLLQHMVLVPSSFVPEWIWGDTLILSRLYLKINFILHMHPHILPKTHPLKSPFRLHFLVSQVTIRQRYRMTCRSDTCLITIQSVQPPLAFIQIRKRNHPPKTPPWEPYSQLARSCTLCSVSLCMSTLGWVPGTVFGERNNG